MGYGIFACLLFSYLGRKIGWYLSKKIFYLLNDGALLFLLLFIWGILIYACAIYMVEYFQLNGFVKWLIAYGAGLYVACPNYGLIDSKSIPNSELAKHKIISWTSQITFLALILMSDFYK